MEENKNLEIKIETPKQDIVKKEQVAQEMGLMLPKNMADQITNTLTNYVNNGLIMPKDYNYQNAIISSYLVIKQDPKLLNCDKNSIANALVDMATLGLNVSKNQGYFIPYDNKLNFQTSYFGKITAIKRIKGIVDVTSDVIYKDTEHELLVDELGNDDIKIIKPCPLDKRTSENIIGAWAKVILDEKVWGKKAYTCIMTLDQIHKSWNQGSMKGNSPAHKNFPEEMCKKTAINRCCKNFVNSAKDQDIYLETLNKVTNNEYDDIENGKKIIESKEIDI